jgi:hypothetical protein
VFRPELTGDAPEQLSLGDANRLLHSLIGQIRTQELVTTDELFYYFPPSPVYCIPFAPKPTSSTIYRHRHQPVPILRRRPQPPVRALSAMCF